MVTPLLVVCIFALAMLLLVHSLPRFRQRSKGLLHFGETRSLLPLRFPDQAVEKANRDIRVFGLQDFDRTRHDHLRVIIRQLLQSARLLDEAHDVPVRFDAVFITGQHIEVLQHDAAALAAHRLNVLVKGGLVRVVIEVAQRIDAVLLANQSDLPARFRLQNAVAAGSPLHIVEHVP